MFWKVSIVFCQFMAFSLFAVGVQAQPTAAAPTSTVIEYVGQMPASDRSKDVVWVHGFCAGSITAVQELVSDIKKRHPRAAIYMTAGREDGKKAAEQQVKSDYVSMLTQDDALSMAIAFERINPKAIILLEHEIRPTLIMMAHLKSIPVYLLNSQYTSGTAKNLDDFGFLYCPLINTVDKVFAQSDQDRQGFINARIIPEKVIAIGNTKAYNVYPKMLALKPNLAALLNTYCTNKKHTVLMVGSVHKGELDHYVALFKQLKPTYPNLKLLLAPRFLDWKEELKQKLQATGYSYAVWEDANTCPADVPAMLNVLTQDLLEKHDIVSVCLFGKMFAMYPIADLFFLGGTFVPIGGHNLLEPSVWGNPMIVGPDICNTKDIADALRAEGALIQVTTQDELMEQTKRLLADQSRLKDMGNKAKQWCQTEAARVAQNMEMLLNCLAAQMVH